MPASSIRSNRPGSSQSPAVYYGYCTRTKTYRMMDLPEYVSNVQEGISQMVNQTASAYQGMYRNMSELAGGTATASRPTRDCGCKDCSCDCCVEDADVLIHTRCGETRRIPITFENDSRRDRPVKLELGKFVTSGGRDLGWNATLSETEFTLRPCDEHVVVLTVQIRCEPENNEGRTGAKRPADAVAIDIRRTGGVDRCEVGYGTIRAEGCLTRPVVVAAAVLPDHCDSYTHPCGCECCHGAHG